LISDVKETPLFEKKSPHQEFNKMACCQAIVCKTQKPCLRKTKEGTDFCGYHSKNEKCSICFDSIEKSKQWVTPCCNKIAFHKTCMDQWTSRGKSSCPLCRATLHKKEDSVLFSGAAAHERLRSESPENVLTRLQGFQYTHRNADHLVEAGPFCIAMYDRHSLFFILDTSNGQVTRTERLELLL
jgi:hypothetical protein